MRCSRSIFWVGAALLLTSCSSSPQPASNGAQTPGRGGRGDASAVPVVTTHVVKKAVPVTLPAIGTVEAVSTVQVRSQVSGQITAIGFNEGDEVKKGQLLFSIDARPFQAALEQARAALARDEATAKNQQS